MRRKIPSRVPGLKGRTPRFWWSGVIVSDSHCDNPGCNHKLHEHNPAGAFAYTTGIHDRLGIPELRLSAAPRPCSDMPVMEVYAMGAVLNAVANQYVKDGPPVSCVAHGWPGGYELRASVPAAHEAVPQQLAECFQAHDDALVLPVEWCAHRDTR